MAMHSTSRGGPGAGPRRKASASPPAAVVCIFMHPPMQRHVGLSTGAMVRLMPPKRTGRVVDPSLLPHERPCWCDACRKTYRAIYYKRNADRWSGEYAAKARERHLSRYENQSSPIWFRSCLADDCNKTWVVRRQDDIKVWCSRQCRQRQAYRDQAPIRQKTCAWCFTTYDSGAGAARRTDTIHCSDFCSKAHQNHWILWHHPTVCHLPVCIECHRITGKQPKAKRCAQCSRANSNRSSPESDARRNARKRRQEAVVTGENVSVQALIDRDGSMCAYPGCGRDVRMDVHHLDVDYATIDHIVPIAAGGLHTMANCQVMHRSCNSKKADKHVGDPVQLKLI